MYFVNIAGLFDWHFLRSHVSVNFALELLYHSAKCFEGCLGVEHVSVVSPVIIVKTYRDTLHNLRFVVDVLGHVDMEFTVT